MSNPSRRKNREKPSRRRIAFLLPMNQFSNWSLADGLCRHSLAWRDWQISVARMEPDFLKNHHYDVIIGEFGDPDLYATYAPLRIPMIAALGTPPPARMPFVEVDQEAIGRVAAEHLIELGFRHFAFLFDGEDLSRHLDPRAPALWTPERRQLESFRRALGRRAESFSVSPPYDPLLDDWRQPLVDWINSLPKPVAFLCPSDFVGRQLTDVCRIEGIAVPGRVSVLGVNDDGHYCLSSHPRLSSIAVPWERVGEMLGTLLDEFFASGKMPRRTIRIPPTGVITRSSTAPVLSGEDPLVADAIALLRARSHDQGNLKELLAGFPVTRRQLERRFYAATGHTPLDELSRLRCEHAKELLADSRLGYEDIAAACGFSGSKHLRRVFQKVAGVTPQDFRAKHARVRNV
jgi:LacI family transcriptional regulator